MNREIKFRAVIKEQNVVEYFTLQDLVNNDFFTIREIVKPWLAKGNFPDRYTGLTDKNGQEIYEGDIVVSDIYEHSKGAVWINDALSCDPFSYYMQGEDFEIIGNIYENPELLNATK